MGMSWRISGFPTGHGKVVGESQGNGGDIFLSDILGHKRTIKKPVSQDLSPPDLNLT